jgi:putative MATE family efflux protein
MANVTLDRRLDTAPYAAIFSLTWPQALMMVFHFLIGFADVWVAGRLGREVQAAVGFMTQAMFFFLVVAVAVANGSVAAVSQSAGAGLTRRVQRFAGLGIGLAMGLGAVMLAAGQALDRVFLRLLQLPPAVFPVAADLLHIFLLILPGYYLLTVSNALFRASKDVITPLWGMMLVTAINALGDFGLGLGWWGLPRLGHLGLAWSTFGSILCGTLFNVAMLVRRGTLTRRSFPTLRWSRRALPYLVAVAWPAGLMQIVWHSAYMVLFALVASLPRDSVAAMAGMSAGMRVESFLFLPGFSFNFTASILIGHLLGQGRVEDARRMGLRIMKLGVLAISVLTLLLWFVIEPIVAFIAPDPTAAPHAISYLAYNMAGTPPMLAALILSGAFVGAGATLYQALIFGGAAWLVRLPLAYFLGHRLLGSAEGVWMAMLVSILVQCAAMFWFYLKTPWWRFTLRKERRPRPL